jgi:hypothetical protein
MNDDLNPASLQALQSEAQPVDAPVISDHQAQMALETIQSEQNLMMGMLAGMVASLVGAGAWAGVTIMTDYQIGWMAIGIGVLVGFAIRYTGKGMGQSFGIVGGAMSLVGCVLGNILYITYYVAINQDMAYMDILTQLNFPIIVEMLSATFAPMDLLFYGLAGYFGYKYAFRQITEQDLNRALGKAI